MSIRRDNDRTLTTRDVADGLRVTRKELTRHLNDRRRPAAEQKFDAASHARFPPMRPAGHDYLITRSDFDAWLRRV